MKITIQTILLQEKLSLLNHAISAKSQLPILSNILIETGQESVKLCSTDLEIGIEVHIQATIEESGACTVPAKTFSELINSLTSDSINLQTRESLLEVSNKKTKSVFQTISHEDFPKLFEDKGEKIAILEGGKIQKDFASVIFSASGDTARPALSGVLVRKEADGFLLVATDGYRLSLKHYKVTNVDTTGKASFIIPARVFKELASFKEGDSPIAMYVSQGRNQVLFEQSGTIIVGRLIEADFPQFEKIIPSDFSVTVSFDREELLKAVKIASIFARDSANIVKLSLQKKSITVSSQSPSVGENTVDVDATLKGEENEIAFNARYILDVLSNVDAKELVFEMTGPLNPGVFKKKDDTSFLHLIMPVRVQE